MDEMKNDLLKNEEGRAAERSEPENKEESSAKEGVVDRAEENENRAGRRKPMRYMHRFLLHALILVILVWMLFGVFLGITTAPSDDMFPRVDAGDLVLYYRLYNGYSANDVVMYKSAETGGTYIGRIIAKTGDTVSVSDKSVLYINGHAVNEENIYYATTQYKGYTDYPLVLGEGEYFILGDKRDNAEDSRYFGPVKRNELIGLVVTIVRRNNL